MRPVGVHAKTKQQERRDHLPCGFVSLSQNFTRQKQVSEKSAKMDGSIQIVDQLGTDYGLGQNELNGSKRIASIAIKNG